MDGLTSIEAIFGGPFWLVAGAGAGLLIATWRWRRLAHGTALASVSPNAAPGSLGPVQPTPEPGPKELIITPENHPETLASLATYLAGFVEEYGAACGLDYSVELPRELPDLTLDPETRQNTVAAVKQAMHRIVRQGRAREVVFQLNVRSGYFEIVLQEDALASESDSRTRHYSFSSEKSRFGRRVGLRPGREAARTVCLLFPFSTQSRNDHRRHCSR
jgi:hypothetical protein